MKEDIKFQNTNKIRNMLTNQSRFSTYGTLEIWNPEKYEETKMKLQNLSLLETNKVVETRLEEILPYKFEETSNYSHEHKHFIDYYDLNKKFLIIRIDSTDTLPREMKDPFVNFDKLVGDLKFKGQIYSPEGATLQVNSYELQGKVRYVVKKNWFSCNDIIYRDDFKTHADNFVRRHFNEYGLMKINYASPYSVKPIDFGIVYLIKKKIIVTEMLTEYGGDSLNKYISEKSLSTAQIYEILLQITEELKYLEISKIEHNDIKASNILLDFIQKMPVIKFIDFDIAKKQSYTDMRSTQKAITGYSDIYMAPELYQAKLKNETNYALYKPFKCQAYSLGILILFLFNFPLLEERKEEFDRLYKGSINNYQLFLEEFKNFCNSSSDPLTERVLKIVQICLSYNSDERLTACELLTIVPFLKNRTLHNINEDYKKILLERKNKNQNGSNAIQLVKGLNQTSLEEQAITDNLFKVLSHKSLNNTQYLI